MRHTLKTRLGRLALATLIAGSSATALVEAGAGTAGAAPAQPPKIISITQKTGPEGHWLTANGTGAPNTWLEVSVHHGAKGIATGNPFPVKADGTFSGKHRFPFFGASFCNQVLTVRVSWAGAVAEKQHVLKCKYHGPAVVRHRPR